MSAIVTYYVIKDYCFIYKSIKNETKDIFQFYTDSKIHISRSY